MYVNVIKNYVEAIIKCRYRLTYMLILLLINLVVFLKWDHVDSNKSLIIVTVCVFVRHLFSFYPFYFDFHSARIIFEVSSGFYLWNINKTTA